MNSSMISARPTSSIAERFDRYLPIVLPCSFGRHAMNTALSGLCFFEILFCHACMHIQEVEKSILCIYFTFGNIPSTVDRHKLTVAMVNKLLYILSVFHVFIDYLPFLRVTTPDSLQSTGSATDMSSTVRLRKQGTVDSVGGSTDDANPTS